MFVQTRKCLSHEFRFVSSLNRSRVGPAEHLCVKFFGKLPAETREACNLVTLRHDNVDRQTHAENLLRLPEFFVETVCFLLDLGAAFMSQLSVAQEIRAWNGEHETVERSLRPVLL